MIIIVCGGPMSMNFVGHLYHRKKNDLTAIENDIKFYEGSFEIFRTWNQYSICKRDNSLVTMNYCIHPGGITNQGLILGVLVYLVLS